MGHKVFISFKFKDVYYKNKLSNNSNIDMIDKSLKEPINSSDEDYIMRKIREDYLKDSTVTVFLIGDASSENINFLGTQNYIKRELQASLTRFNGGLRNGIIGVVLPQMEEKIFYGKYECSICGFEHNQVQIDDSNTIKEFNYNYYLPLDESKHVWSDNDRYCILVKWNDFINEPNKYIDEAYDKRTNEYLNKKVRVRP